MRVKQTIKKYLIRCGVIKPYKKEVNKKGVVFIF